jgi:hypothetical protein
LKHFVGMDFDGLGAAPDVPGPQGLGRSLAVRQAAATRDDALSQAEHDDDIVLGVEVAVTDLPCLARALRSRFPGPLSARQDTRSTGSVGLDTQPAATQGSTTALAPSRTIAPVPTVVSESERSCESLLGDGALRAVLPHTLQGRGGALQPSAGDSDSDVEL